MHDLIERARGDRPESPPAFSLRLFGPLCVEVGGLPLPRLRSQKGAWILALLALRSGREVSRSWLAGTLWPESDESQALANLRLSLSDLRRALGGEAKRLHSPSRALLALDLSGADADAAEFDRSMRAGDADSLERAVGLYRGPLLEGCDEEWIYQERAAREREYREALERLTAGAREREDWASAREWAVRWAEADPLNEGAFRSLMEAHAALGRYADAVHAYRRLRETLLQELRVEPSAETRRLFDVLREEGRTRSALSPRPASSPVVSPSIPSSDPAAPSFSPSESFSEPEAPALRGFVPRLSSFVGREKEIEEIRRILGFSRLTTLVGAGGCGKTRLALRIAETVAPDYGEGAAFVDLAPITDPHLIPVAAASALGIAEEAGRPLPETLQDRLREASLLMVLDNCEHLIEGAAVFAERLLSESSRLRILATSRERLRIEGERAYRVPSLSLPGPDETSEAALTREAPRLFMERAAAADAAFQLTRENGRAILRICRQLDGIPLAIELAAARTGVLSAEEIADRLESGLLPLSGGGRTVLPRQRTLRATIDWSYDLLAEPEKALFRRLSAFVGGWTLDSAEAVASGGDLREGEALDALAELAEKSLAVAEAESGKTRHRFSEPIRQAARELLIESGEEEAVRARHFGYFLALAEEAEARMGEPERGEWLNRLESEIDNLRAALAWSELQGDAHLRLAAALGPFWRFRDRVPEGVGWIEGALSRNPTAPPRLRARALEERVRLERQTVAIGPVLEEAVALYREGGDFGGTARCLALLARYHYLQIDKKRAVLMAQESMRIARSLNDRRTLYETLYYAGWGIIYATGTAQGVSELHEALSLAQEIGNPYEIADCWDSLAWLHVYRQEPDQPRDCLRKALPYARAAGSRRLLLYILGRLSRCALEPEDSAELAFHLRDGVDAARGLGWVPYQTGLYLGELAEAVLRAGRAAEAEPWLKAATEMKPGRALIRAICLAHLGLARLAFERGDADAARRRLETLFRAARTVGGAGAVMGLAEATEETRRSGTPLLGLLDACEAVCAVGIPPEEVGDANGHIEMFLRALSAVERLARESGRFGLAYSARLRKAAFLYHTSWANCAEEWEALASAAARMGDGKRAATLLGAAAAQAESQGQALPLGSEEDYHAADRAARSALGEEAFAAAYAEGRSMTLQEAVVYALGG
jgi:predicted ATPase/DNA-binding SARP family transcriptional activator